jgi:hypothetical protein
MEMEPGYGTRLFDMRSTNHLEDAHSPKICIATVLVPPPSSPDPVTRPACADLTAINDGYAKEPDWNAIPSRASTRAPQPFLEPPSRSSWNVPAGNADRHHGRILVVAGSKTIRTSYPMLRPTTIGFQTRNMREMDITTLREQSIESSRFRRKHGTYLTRRQPGGFHSSGGTNTMISIAYTTMRSKNS